MLPAKPGTRTLLESSISSQGGHTAALLPLESKKRAKESQQCIEQKCFQSQAGRGGSKVPPVLQVCSTHITLTLET